MADTLQRQIKFKTVTATTNSHGSINIGFSVRSIILSIFAIGKGDVCIVPSVSGSGNENGSTTWWVACRNVDDWSPYTKTQISFRVVYIEP